MRIGQFSSETGVSEYTIRYYIASGLIVPEAVINGQFRFGDGSLKDLAMILEFKEEGFTIAEIHRIISISRIAAFSDADDRKELSSMRRSKLNNIEHELCNIDASIAKLESMIIDSGGLDASV